MMMQIVKLMRIEHYVKNLFIFLPLYFGFSLLKIDSLIHTFYTFLFFSLVTSAVYIFNDYCDMDDDRKHPVKKERPLASGKISKNTSLVIMTILGLSGIGGSYALDINIFIIVLIYVAQNILYTLILKNIALIDVMVIANGFVLRLFAGSFASHVSLSMWIIIMTFLLALFLAFGKRREDVALYLASGTEARKSVRGYNMEFLNTAMIIMATVIIISYIMYTISPGIMMASRVHSDKAYLTVIWVILGILRYLQKTIVYNDTGSPTRVLLSDRFLQIIMAGWVVSFGLLIYL